MRFDTEEAFFKATYTASRMSPAQIGRIAVDPKEDRAREVTTAVVALMRGAFAVHRRCTGQVDGNSTLLEYRLIGASRDLPDGWKVVVVAERGMLRLDLYNPDDERVEFPDVARDELSGQVYDAIEAAIAGAKEA
ncbi:hypothetical protein [Burkholderia multivorans]|uniref:hypothetical protein n=1 Tax=Burkholderia multivorans TaxID=87883 RepID=UPI001C250C92|nr:hypothetical protein [Burkholderia multivorans]MBU9340673.1 hypothetical protein [Burkholderia multivorans]WVN03746.1 hypothetical protein V1241_16520 [Burkholderia multivorans]